MPDALPILPLCTENAPPDPPCREVGEEGGAAAMCHEQLSDAKSAGARDGAAEELLPATHAAFVVVLIVSGCGWLGDRLDACVKP